MQRMLSLFNDPSDPNPEDPVHFLDDQDWVRMERLPDRLIWTREEFEEIWNSRPTEYPKLKIHGRMVKIPRWHRAYGRDYAFSGQVSEAEPIDSVFQPLLDWARETIEPRLNGLLVNWYDGAFGHYIGAHRDSESGLIPGTPIVTCSFGARRVFRMRYWRSPQSRHDCMIESGDCVIIPFQTNQRWTHEVPAMKRYPGRRISVTIRAFAG